MKKLALLLALAATPALAQGPYTRASVSVLQADAIVAAASKEAEKRKAVITVVVVDEAGQIVIARRMNGSQPQTMEIARRKAITAALVKMPTKPLQDGFAAPGGSLILSIPDVMPIQGGLPIQQDGRTIGAVGVSGDAAPVDEAIAQAGLDAIGKP